MSKRGEGAERGELRLGSGDLDAARRRSWRGRVYCGLGLIVLAGCLGGMGTPAALGRVAHRIPSVVGRPARARGRVAGGGNARFCPLRFSKPRNYNVAGGVSNMAVADLGNGHPDIVLADQVGDAVQVFYGRGDGRIGRMRSYRVRGGPYALVITDLGNGHPDIVVTQPNKDAVTVLYGAGGGRIGPIRSYRVGRNPQGLAVADFGNGYPDIVAANTHTVSVLYGVGDGRIGPIRSYRVEKEPFGLVVADLGNGYPDIVVANTHTVSVLYGVGGGRFAPPVVYPVPGGRWVESMKVADLGNGHPDIVMGLGTPKVFSKGGDAVDILYGIGGGRFAPPVLYPVGTEGRRPREGMYPLVVADLGNGHPDIIGVEGFQGEMSVLYGEGEERGCVGHPLPAVPKRPGPAGSISHVKN